MTRVLGFEGGLNPGFDVTWGAAALEIDGRLVNAVTRLQSPLEDLQRLGDEGHVFKLSKPVKIPPQEADRPLLLLAVNSASPHAAVLKVPAGRHGGVVKRVSQGSATFFILRDQDALRIYSRDVAHKILKGILAAATPDEGALDQVRAGLSLDPSHPYLNALRVYLTPPERQERALRLARARVRGSKGRTALDTFYNALSSKEKAYEFYYEHGITEGGGLDVNYAHKILSGVERAVRKLSNEVKLSFPFLPSVPSPRLLAMTPSSARMTFAADIEKRPLGERVRRYLELRALDDALQGEASADLIDDYTFVSAIESIVRPSAESSTTLSQKAFEEEKPRLVTYDDPPQGETSDDHFAMLGVLTGGLSDSGKLELRVFPGARGRLILSTSDNGEGGEPEGLNFLQSPNLPLHRLAIANLIRRSDALGREKFYLKGMSLLEEEKPAYINAFPSSVVRGAFLSIGNVRVLQNSDGIVALGDRAASAFTQSQHASYSWLAEYRDLVLDLEVASSKANWWMAIRAPRPSSLDRVLVSLYRLGGECFANVLAEEVSRRFDVIARVNNTRRAVNKHPDLLKWDEERKFAALTTRGLQYVEAYIKAGGQTGTERPQ